VGALQNVAKFKLLEDTIFSSEVIKATNEGGPAINIGKSRKLTVGLV
jgi:hypothetical protein